MRRAAKESKALAGACYNDPWRAWQLYPDQAWQPHWTEELAQASQHLLQGIPIQHVMGYTEFYGHKFRVSEDVLIPRMETEAGAWILADESARRSLTYLDVGTGSGCIALSLAAEWADGRLACAAMRWMSQRLLWLLPRECCCAIIPDELAPAKHIRVYIFRFCGLDVIVSNPPYVTQSDKAQMSTLVLDHDPDLALFAPAEDALAFYRVIAQRAMDWLKPGGRLYLEINESLGPETVTVCEQAGLRNLVLRQDLNGKDRMAQGEK